MNAPLALLRLRCPVCSQADHVRSEAVIILHTTDGDRLEWVCARWCGLVSQTLWPEWRDLLTVHGVTLREVWDTTSAEDGRLDDAVVAGFARRLAARDDLAAVAATEARRIHRTRVRRRPCA